MKKVWQMFREVIDGLVHIHTQGMIHRQHMQNCTVLSFELFTRPKTWLIFPKYGFRISLEGTVY